MGRSPEFSQFPSPVSKVGLALEPAFETFVALAGTMDGEKERATRRFESQPEIEIGLESLRRYFGHRSNQGGVGLVSDVRSHLLRGSQRRINMRSDDILKIFRLKRNMPSQRVIKSGLWKS